LLLTMSPPQILFLLDGTLFVVAVAAWLVPITGLPLHEWLGLALSAIILVHIVFQWNWLASAVKRLVKPGAWRLRVNVVVNSSLFAAAIIAIYSGAMISEVALPEIGLVPAVNPTWAHVHGISNLLMAFLVGLHIAINWRWITGVARRLGAMRHFGPSRLGSSGRDPQTSAPEGEL